MIYYITGGERSGKSSYAQKLAETLSPNPIYLATARIWDSNFKERVDRHLSDRDNRWTTIEAEKHLSAVIPQNSTILIDCVTLWITNFYVDCQYNVTDTLTALKNELSLLKNINATIIIISNEIGMGVHASTEMARKFTEIQGWINQEIAKMSNSATLMVSGLPLTLK